MKSIILLGYMCVGKTTVGKALASQLNIPFYDLDWYIEKRYRMDISELFAENGEKGFRNIERRMLHEVAEFENIVLSCGGGTPCFFDNMEYMNHVGNTIFLNASTETIIAHYKLSHTVRPLLKDKQDHILKNFIEDQIKQRQRYYTRAKYTFCVDILDDSTKIKNFANLIRQELIQNNGKMEN